MLYVLIVRIVFCFNNYLIPIGSVVDQVSPQTSHLASLVENYYDIRRSDLRTTPQYYKEIYSLACLG